MSSSVHANNVVDLVGGSPSPPCRDQQNQRRKRRSPRFNGNNNNNNNALVMNNNNKNDTKMSASKMAARRTEVIDLADVDDSSPSPEIMIMGTRNSTRKRTRKRRHRQQQNIMRLNVDDDDDDDDDVEIINPKSPGHLIFDPPSVAAAAASSTSASATTSMSQQQSPPMDKINRIREVFPLVSRGKVETFLSMAKSYSSNDDHTAFLLVMTVLSEDPLGTTISNATFAAAAVGGRLEQVDTMPSPPGSGIKGRRKVAQLECQCCYVEYEYEVMVSCRKGGHLFCKTCLQKHTEQRVFGLGNFGNKPSSTNGKSTSSKALEILCMSAGCESGFNEGQLKKALSEKVLKKYNELQFAAVIESAGMNICKCPKDGCEFMAVPDELWPPLLFHCPSCNFKSCRECGDEYHPNIRCDQVESKTEANGRTKVEEAMTQALVRTCPRPMCRKKFLKLDGCNKMTCSCSALVCYVCRKEIPKTVAYKHFCQTPHCKHQSCNKCPLYADTTHADKTRVTNAAKKAARSVRKNVKVDVDSMLKDPPPAQFGRKR